MAIFNSYVSHYQRVLGLVLDYGKWLIRIVGWTN